MAGSSNAVPCAPGRGNNQRSAVTLTPPTIDGAGVTIKRHRRSEIFLVMARGA